MKSITALALAAIVALSLSGCTVFNTFISAGDEALLSSDLDALVDDLASIPGVDAVDYDLLIQPDMSYTVSVSAYATDLTERSASDAFALVTSTYASGRFPEQKSLAFGIGPGGDGRSTAIAVSSWLEFPTEVIPDEIAYLYDVQEAVGAPLSMSLDAPGDLAVNYQRFIGSSVLPDTLDWAALRKIPDTGAGFVGLSLGGVSMDGGVIPTAAEKVATRAAAIEDVEMVWNGVEGEYGVSLYTADGDYAALAEWPAVVALVDSAIASDSGFHSLLISFDEGMAVVSGNECGADIPVTESDRELQDLLRAAGVDVSAGYC